MRNRQLSAILRNQRRVLISLWIITCPLWLRSQPKPQHDLLFEKILVRWDEGIPLGNGMLGALIWQKDSVLRISLDRADLWDLRTIAEFGLPQFRFSWVYQQWKNNSYDTVQKLFDVPYEREPGPTKLPTGALEIPLNGMGPVEYIRLNLKDATCEIRWNSGASLTVFVDANREIGWFRMEDPGSSFRVELIPPAYHVGDDSAFANSSTGQELSRLGYPPADHIINEPGHLSFSQQCYGDLQYKVTVTWKQTGPHMAEGCWQVTRSADTTDNHPAEPQPTFATALREHIEWWSGYWNQSSVSIPDTLLERQYYREMYKFGSASRKGAPPITLQAVWTADNGRLPPWKGDFHHDLNTELSYWPGYASNHLEETAVFTDWILKNRQAARKYTETFFQCKGINFPGVSTLTGQPMGGWIQYALSPTVSAWLSHHFYLQWKYSLDTNFLITSAYPFIRETALFLDAMLSEKDGRFRKLPLSSSPEFFDNSRNAWFRDMTNYDIALTRWLFQTAAGLAAWCAEAGIQDPANIDYRGEALKWKRLTRHLPPLTVSGQEGLTVAPGLLYHDSHRHFSHLMSIHPLGLYDWQEGKHGRLIIEKSIKTLEKAGTGNWTGYSFAWFACMKARACDGDGAAEALKTFASCFCSPNSFHLNGDQSGTGKSTMTYSPFTLEGNFAFAAALQEMLLQSQNGTISIFPAIPAKWESASFRNLRAEGAFLVSAVRRCGRTQSVSIHAEKGGLLRVMNPFGSTRISVAGAKGVRFVEKGILSVLTSAGQTITFSEKP